MQIPARFRYVTVGCEAWRRYYPKCLARHTYFFVYTALLDSLFFILVINQLDAQNLFYNKFISCLYMFRAPCAHRQEVKIVRVLYSLWYHHTYRCDDTRGCITQF